MAQVLLISHTLSYPSPHRMRSADTIREERFEEKKGGPSLRYFIPALLIIPELAAFSFGTKVKQA